MYNLTDIEAAEAMQSSATKSLTGSGGFNESWHYIETNENTAKEMTPMRKRHQSVLQDRQMAFSDNQVDMVSFDAKAVCSQPVAKPSGSINFENWYELKGRFIDSSEFDDLLAN